MALRDLWKGKGDAEAPATTPATTPAATPATTAAAPPATAAASAATAAAAATTSATEPPRMPLPSLVAALSGLVPHHRDRTPHTDLVRARLADGLRDRGLVPVLPERFATAFDGMAEEDRRRFALVVDAVRAADVPVGPNAAGRRDGTHATEALFSVVQQSSLLGLEVLGQSALRAEELARRLLAHWSCAVVGEDPQQSALRLYQLDYARLQREAAAAKAAAEARLKELERRKSEQEQRMRGRGKW